MSISNDYNRTAAIYDLLGKLVYWGALMRSQKEFLNLIPEGKRMLIIGGGTGRILDPVLKMAKPHSVDYVEKSRRMIEKSRQNCQHADKTRVRFIHGTEEEIQNEHYDVVISFFFFDQFEGEELRQISETLNATLRKGGLWLWADFIPPQNWWQRLLMKLMHLYFKAATNLSARKVPEMYVLFERMGFRQKEKKAFYGGFIQTGVFEKRQ